MHEEFAPDFLSEDFLLSSVPEEDEEEVDEADIEAEDEEEAADIEEEML